MLEAQLRKIHRGVGIFLAGFLAVQAFTGLFIALGTLQGAPRESLWFALMAGIHHDWDPLGSAFRMLLGAVTLGQVLGGVMLYRLVRARMKQT